jgi:hypothetical protein
MLALVFERDDKALLIFFGLSVVLGGAASFSAGRALAKNWRPLWYALAYAIPLAAALRFLHYALFAEPMVSGWRYALDYAVILGFALAGFKLTRRRQMQRNYGWMAAARPDVKGNKP